MTSKETYQYIEIRMDKQQPARHGAPHGKEREAAARQGLMKRLGELNLARGGNGQEMPLPPAWGGSPRRQADQ